MNFKEFFLESEKKKLNKASSKGLDISIKHLQKEIKTVDDKEEFLNSYISVTEKLDGTKLTLIRTSSPKSTDYTANWIVAYKGTVLFADEMKHLDLDRVRKQSIGVSQYALVHAHLKAINASLDDSVVKPGTEFFVEFMQRKDTLTREYEQLHGLVLLGKAPTKYRIVGTRLKSTPEEMSFDVEKESKALKIPQPTILFEGITKSKKDIENGIVSDNIKVAYDKHQVDFDESPDGLFDLLVIMFQDFDSVFGGIPEGVVITTSNGELFKVVQKDQYSKTTRGAVKDKFRYDHETMQKYWDYVAKVANKLVDKIDTNQPVTEMLGDLADIVRSDEVEFDVSSVDPDAKRRGQIAEDDLYLTAKMRLEKRMKGHRYAMFIGRFQPATAAHEMIVRDALKEDNIDGVVICIVAGKISSKNLTKNPLSYDERVSLWKKALPGENIEFYQVKTGALGPALRDIPFPVFSVLCGQDRAESYSKQLRGDLVDLVVISRDEDADDNVSATKLRQAIRDNDFATAKEMGGTYINKETFEFLKTKLKL